MTAYTSPQKMPVIETSSGVVLIAALLPIAAAPAVVSPDAVAAYTLIGALLAVLLAVSYMRMNAKTAWNYPQTAFTIVSTLAVGWLVPEPLAWWASRKGWVTPDEIETIPKQAWALTALAFGIGGSTLILTGMHWWRQRFPKAFEEESARVQLPSGSEFLISRTKSSAADQPPPNP